MNDLTGEGTGQDYRTIECPGCGNPLTIPSRWENKQVRCKFCRCQFVIRPAGAIRSGPPEKISTAGRPPTAGKGRAGAKAETGLLQRPYLWGSAAGGVVLSLLVLVVVLLVNRENPPPDDPPAGARASASTEQPPRKPPPAGLPDTERPGAAGTTDKPPDTPGQPGVSVTPPETPAEVPPSPAQPPDTTPPGKEEKPAAPGAPDAVLENVKRATAYIEGKRGSGTAFVVGPGILVTNNHVLQDEYIDDFRVRFISDKNPTAKALPVKLLYRDRRRDLALLAVESDEAPLTLAKAEEVQKGHPIAVIGHPGRLGGAFTELHVVTEGTVSGLAVIEQETWYHLKVEAAPGNSGGPVIDRKTGEVIGVLTLGIRKPEDDLGRFPFPVPNPFQPPPGAPAQPKKPPDSFGIPSAFVQDAVAKVEAVKDRDKLSEEVTERYAAEMVTLQVCLAQRLGTKAANAQLRMRQPLRGFNPLDIRIMSAFPDIHKQLMEALAPAIRQVQSARHLPADTRKAVGDLLRNYAEMKRMVENPRALNVRSFNARAKEHEKLVKRLFEALGIPDRVEVQLLE